MNLLGLDTSTAATAACVLRADGEAFESVPDPSALTAPPAHARELLPALAALLDRARLDWSDLDAIAVGVGPGGFTGLRIGIATARALAGSAGVELRPVSSLAALAAGIDAGAEASLQRAVGGGGPPAASPSAVLPVLDAKRSEVFAALYEGGVERWPPFAARPEGLAERVRAEGVIPWAAGDGSVRFRGVLEAAGIRVAPDGSPAHVVRALHVCRLATDAVPTAPEAVLPEYLRAPDAKPQ